MPDPIDPEVERRAREFTEFLLTLPTDEARRAALGVIHEDVCDLCGKVLDGRPCYCARGYDE